MNRRFNNCLITGITGSGGSYLAEHILNRDKKIKIHGFYRSKGYYNIVKKYKTIKTYKVDLLNYLKVYKNLKKIKPDVIFHLASNADVRDSFNNPISFAKNNNSITINLLEAIRKLNINPVIIICSTSEVYGQVDKKNMPIKENSQISPINPYAVTKTFQDLISQVYHKSFGLNIIITRMFSYTNGRRDNLFQTAFAKQIAEIELGKKKFLKHGNLKSIRTLLDINDAMEAYWLTAKKGKIGEIYNIGGNRTISVGDFLIRLMKLSKSEIKCRLDKSLLRPRDIPLQVVDCSKFKRDTGWKPLTKFSISLKKLLEECRHNVI
ncbi:MAG: GDP-mannose 4,6-dehydratase [Candidatus Pelagibacter sp.]|tara:strand:- start:148 stop:1113 length:966 start_codon:yes stop_codon:yes gene_type:complete